MINQNNILGYLQFDCPTFEQKKALYEMSAFIETTNINDFYILSGAAGTGKTSITTALIGYLNYKAIFYNIAAPTGRAARILGRKSKTVNSTIHSLIYNSKPTPETGEINFVLKTNPVSDFTVFIIDEASMISSKITNEPGSLFKSSNSLLSDLIRYVKSGNSKNKIIFMGDRNQLPPIKETNSMALCEEYLKGKFSLLGTSQLLTEVKRQEDGSYILKNAIHIREAIEQNLSKVVLHGIEKQHLETATSKYVKAYLNNGYDSVISIGATHNMNSAFNNVVRSKIYGKKAKSIEKEDLLLVTQTWKRNGYQLYSGDHIIVKEVDLTNIESVAGLHFVPVKLLSKTLEGNEEVIEDYLLLESIFNPGGLKPEQENKLRHERFTKNKVYRESGNTSDDRYVGAIRTTYGHSITCNKAQGGEWNQVYLNSYFMPTLRYQYTAVTRAKQNLTLY
ncbi:ATP-dependent RecD-like DNA helicase [Polaribacter sp. 11A2H]|uniref:ATP-dependent DNA helicase n=1 Tax=Polaribacter sp. 11A2H TaxID=2687290 RepID=UPI001408F9C9|nr:AAA family ATPase [Polaribacter sp. 11A2H]